jgi:hypothetical protein
VKKATGGGGGGAIFVTSGFEYSVLLSVSEISLKCVNSWVLNATKLKIIVWNVTPSSLITGTDVSDKSGDSIIGLEEIHTVLTNNFLSVKYIFRFGQDVLSRPG